MTKGKQIADYLAAHPEASRKEVATAVGCTVTRVGEVVPAKAHVPTTIDNPDPEPTPVTEPEPAAEPPETRTARCEHEKARKAKTGTCKECPPIAQAS